MPESTTPDIPPATGDYTGYQDYLDDGINGIYARAAWSTPGAKGDLVRIIDIESGWNLSHEDLPGFNPVPDPNSADADHGTAVVGVLVGEEDGSGVTGIVPNATIGAISKDRRTGFGLISNISDSILDAAVELSEGDVILIEQHLMGPRKADCTCETDDGAPRTQCGYVPVEWLDHNYDAIVAASTSGIIVVEPAGNGEQDLDDPIYDNRFKWDWRDSGAIMVAGGSSGSRTRECFSNHGARIDLHGWGEDVTTTGYGDGTQDCNGDSTCMNKRESQVGGAGDRNQYYTSTFNGTSSASPIVAGAVAAIQGVQFANNNRPLDWVEMRCWSLPARLRRPVMTSARFPICRRPSRSCSHPDRRTRNTRHRSCSVPRNLPQRLRDCPRQTQTSGNCAAAPIFSRRSSGSCSPNAATGPAISASSWPTSPITCSARARSWTNAARRGGPASPRPTCRF